MSTVSSKAEYVDVNKVISKKCVFTRPDSLTSDKQKELMKKPEKITEGGKILSFTKKKTARFSISGNTASNNIQESLENHIGEQPEELEGMGRNESEITNVSVSVPAVTNDLLPVDSEIVVSENYTMAPEIAYNSTMLTEGTEEDATTESIDITKPVEKVEVHSLNEVLSEPETEPTVQVLATSAETPTKPTNTKKTVKPAKSVKSEKDTETTEETAKKETKKKTVKASK